MMSVYIIKNIQKSPVLIKLFNGKEKKLKINDIFICQSDFLNESILQPYVDTDQLDVTIVFFEEEGCLNWRKEGF